MSYHRWMANRAEVIKQQRRPTLSFLNPTWLFPPIVPVEMPVGLNHLESDLCWCDPIIEVDKIGEEVMLHRQVSWN
jgi:hypothetical protein